MQDGQYIDWIGLAQNRNQWRAILVSLHDW
jgi:hypothetical protein